MPKVSVVVPTCRRPDRLGRCLDALATQGLDRAEFEIIVVDDAGEEATRLLVESRAARYLATSGGPLGPAAARNLGWRGASAAVIAFTDDDCLPDPGWLVEGLDALGRDAVAATGRVVVPISETPTDYERDAAGLAGAEFVTANLFCRRDALEALGGFDERFAVAWREDSDLHFALIGHGGRIARAPLAVVVHPVRPAPWGVSLGQQRKSLFDALLFKKHPDLYRRKIRPSPPWGYYITVASAASALLGLGIGSRALALISTALWAGLTARFCLARLRRTTLAPTHVAEMAATSAAIPFLSVFWRLYGAWKFRSRFL